MSQLNDIQSFFDTSLNILSEHYQFSDEAANVCYENNLTDLKTMLLYFVGNENFLKLSNIGIKTDEELCVFCKSILEGDAINVLKVSKGEKLENMIGEESLKLSLSKLTKIYGLSVRAFNVCDANKLHNLGDILIYFKQNDNFLKFRNIGSKTNEELCVFCRTISEKNVSSFETGENKKISDIISNETLNLSLNRLTEYCNLSVRAINVCDSNDLHDLEAILTYFTKHGDFFDFRNIGRKTNDELCLFCKNILENDVINSFFSDENEKSNNVLNNLSFVQHKLINQVIKREITVLSPRAINVLNKHCDENITFSKLYASFQDRSKIVKLDLIGKKTAEELLVFIDLIEAKALRITQFDDSEIETNLFSEILMAAFSLQSSEMYTYEQAILTTGNFPIFKFLNWLVNENKLLNERETVVLRARFGYFTNSEKITIDELSVQFNVTRERMRQIYMRTDSLLSKTLEPLGAIKNEIIPYLKYPIDFSKDIIHVRKSLAKEINVNEGCFFTPKFITKVFGHLYPDMYDMIGLNLKHFDNTYLVNRNLAAQFDFNAFFNAIQIQLEEDIEEDYLLDFEGYLMTFLRLPEFVSCLLRVKNVCEDIISSEYTEGVEVDWIGNIVFKRNTQIKRYELVMDILEESGEPMKLQDIHEILCRSHPKFVDKDIETLRSLIRQEKDVFIYFGRSSTYGLAKWEKERKNVKGGTIRDIIEAFLNESSEPQHVLAITEYVSNYRPDTSCNSVNSSMLLVKDRFRDMGNWFWGLPSKTYASFTCIKVPKFFNKRILEFMAIYPETTELEMIEQLAHKHGLKTIQIKYYIQYCLELGKLKRENGQLSYDENSISA